jgi:hypothetical protein
MRNIHVIYGDVTLKRFLILQYHGIAIERGFSSFNIEENEIYFKLKPHFDNWEFSDHAFSKFDDTELDKARYLCCFPNWQPLYPESAGDSGYKSLTYDTTSYCKKSGTGLVQKSPFRVKKEPKWGKYKAFMLHWISDEIFVHIDVYKKIFEPIGIKYYPLLLFKKDTIIESMVQLILPESNVELDLKNYSKMICSDCNHEKYELINYDFFPSFKENVNSNLQIFKSKEYFSGGGLDARKMIFVTQELRQILIRENVSFTYHPLK